MWSIQYACGLLQVVYFNTYLADPRRPQLPEHSTTRMLLQSRDGHLAVPGGFHGPPPPVMGYRPPPVVYPGLSQFIYFVSCVLLLAAKLCSSHPNDVAALLEANISWFLSCVVYAMAPCLSLHLSQASVLSEQLNLLSFK